MQKEVDLTLGERRQINLAKRAPGTVQFLIVDEQSNPIAGARCNIRTASGTWVNPNWQAMRKEGLIGENFDWNRAMSSGEDGGCTRYHVPPGVLTVWAQKNGYAMAGENPQIEVASGSVTEVTLTLKKTK